jgi:predicted HicB family RNase H-like nuclease
MGMIATKNQQLMQLALDKDLHRQLKVRCVERGISMNEQIERLVREWLKKQK